MKIIPLAELIISTPLFLFYSSLLGLNGRSNSQTTLKNARIEKSLLGMSIVKKFLYELHRSKVLQKSDL